MSEALETHHHAEHAASSGGRRAALLIAVAAAVLALCQQGAKHAEIHLQQSAIAAADLWNQYQAKSVRSTLTGDIAALAALPELGAEAAARRDALLARLAADVQRFDHAPDDGRDALAVRAHALEVQRDHAREVSEAFDNAAAGLELGIVLATASVITAAGPLLWLAAALTGAGAVLGVLALLVPALAAF